MLLFSSSLGSLWKKFFILVTLVTIVVLGIVGYAFYFSSKTIVELLTENKHLRQAIGNLTEEDQIGYAKVISQGENTDGVLMTRLIFVTTDRHDPTKRLLEREYEIEGDIIYFDALIVKFSNETVSDGRERALFLWRRVYGENMRPADGYPIEVEGKESVRYRDLCARLSIKEKDLFWSEVWNLSNDPDSLKKIGVTAIYGNVVYKKVRPGLIYLFNISNTGALYPQVVPDL